MLKVLCIAGARPNFMKIAPIMRAFGAHPEIEPYLIHTGQHYDEKMSRLFFDELEIPKPDRNLGIHGGTPTSQTAAIMQAFEPVCKEYSPDMVLVVGDVNSTVACGLTAVHLGIPLIHVEAGLRSRDRTMPEEINRIVTDSISSFLFCSEPSAVINLGNEGRFGDEVHHVGNVMIDTLLVNLPKAKALPTLSEMDLEPGGYGVMTLHRPSNVDDPKTFSRILGIVDEVQKQYPIVFPIHPRTRKNAETFGLYGRIAKMKNLRITEPLGYLELLNLNAHAKFVMTDSGGIQEELTVLKVPCLTLRENTERPITCEQGSNQLVGTDPDRFRAAFEKIITGTFREITVPALWDGKAADRIAYLITSEWIARKSPKPFPGNL